MQVDRDVMSNNDEQRILAGKEVAKTDVAERSPAKNIKEELEKIKSGNLSRTCPKAPPLASPPFVPFEERSPASAAHHAI